MTETPFEALVGREPITRYTLDVSTSAKGEVNVSFKITAELPTADWDRLPAMLTGLSIAASEEAAKTKERYLAHIRRAEALTERAKAHAGAMTAEERDEYGRTPEEVKAILHAMPEPEPVWSKTAIVRSSASD